MQAPRFKWEWNLNTIAVIAGFVATLIAWGYMLSELQTGNRVNRESIERLDKRVTTIEAEARRLDTHELRLSAVEKQSVDASAAMRAVETTLSGLSSDIRVVREILQRIEASGASRQ